MLYLLKCYSSASLGNLFEDVTSCKPSNAEEDLEDGDCTGGIYGQSRQENKCIKDNYDGN